MYVISVHMHLVVAFALPKGIDRRLTVDLWAAVPFRSTSSALSRVCGALDCVQRLIYDEIIVLEIASLRYFYSMYFFLFFPFVDGFVLPLVNRIHPLL